MKKQVYNFVLVLSGLGEPDGRLEDNLYDAGCDDAILSFRNGIPGLELDREAASLEEAIASAVQKLEGAGSRLRVVRVEPGNSDHSQDPVNAAW